jgi:hypothetical protein
MVTIQQGFERIVKQGKLDFKKLISVAAKIQLKPLKETSEKMFAMCNGKFQFEGLKVPELRLIMVMAWNGKFY